MKQTIMEAAQEYEGIVTPGDLHSVFNVIQFMQIRGGHGSFTVFLDNGHVKDMEIRITSAPKKPTAPTPASAWLNLFFLGSSQLAEKIRGIFCTKSPRGDS